MLLKFKKYIAENKLISPTDKVLLAVSGGIDSMVMAHLFKQLTNETGIAHCNFSLRAGESDKDEELVRRYAGENDIPFFSIRFETKTFAKKNSLSVQMAARELRYKWFEEIRRENKYDLIAVAHNLNDNIETLLINLIRGTGITGMTGMRPLSNKIVRPLLFATRHDITEYCHRHGINFREDMSNSDTKYTRNKIRHLVLPVMKEINPSIESTLNETALRFGGINDIVSDYTSGLKEIIAGKKGNLIIFDTVLLKPHLQNTAIIFELFKTYGISNDQLTDLIKVIKGKTGGMIITPGYRIIKNRKEIIVSGEMDENKEEFSIADIKGFSKIPGIASARYINMSEKFKISHSPAEACIDAEKISFPLTVRKWRSGDFFYPLGMKERKKLSDFFIDNKYSKLEKEDIMILESGGEIVWVIGDRIDNRYRITESTKKVLFLKADRK